MRHYERLAHRYFQAWNAHDVSSLKGLFAESVTLRDWNGEHIGKVAVAAANAAIFSAEPKISIAVQQCHVAESTRTTTCEILVHLNNVKGTVLKVADVITYDDSDMIASVRAYQG